MSSTDTGTNEGLVRVIGARALGLSVVNLVLGAGIFALPGRVAAELGAAAIIAYLLCSIVLALVFLCFAEVGSRVSRSGGAHAYIEEAFGPSVGFVVWTGVRFGRRSASQVTDSRKLRSPNGGQCSTPVHSANAESI